MIIKNIYARLKESSDAKMKMRTRSSRGKHDAPRAKQDEEQIVQTLD